jgi:hypothetical protein
MSTTLATRANRWDSIRSYRNDLGAIVNGSLINAAETAGLDLDATGTDRVFWLGGTAGSEKLKALADGTLLLADYAQSTDLDGLSASIRATSAPTTRSDGSALVDGDGWLDSANGNKPYTWNGTSWVAAYTEIDGGAITTGSIVSGNYSAGSAGWSINEDGSAELNEVTVRGTVVVDTATAAEDAINFAYDGSSVGRIHTDSLRVTYEGPFSGPKIVMFQSGGDNQMTISGDDVLSLAGAVINIFGIPISIGANDSGGTGYRVLRVPNG